MVSRRITASEPEQSRRRPATTPQGRERQMIALAEQSAEKLMRDGKAPAQIITHYLKLGSSREQLEQERLAMEVSLLEVKRETMASAARVEELYTDAINAMRVYSGNAGTSGDDHDS